MDIKGIPKDTFKEVEILGMDEFVEKYSDKVVVMDVLGTMYNFIMENMMLKRYNLITNYFTKLCRGLYQVDLVIDGTDHSMEKLNTHKSRIKSKEKKLNEFNLSLGKMQERVDNSQRISKQRSHLAAKPEDQ
jgi:hypothetical protein